MATPKMQDEREAQQALLEGEEFTNLNDEDTGDNGDDGSSDSTPTPAPQVDDVPEKYKGKSAQELIAMHQEAERFNGKQSSEVGELRKSVDQLIQAQLSTVAPTAAPAPSDEEPVDFFTDPEKAMDQKLANHPSIKAAEANAIKLAKQTATAQLNAAHPDMDSILADEKFADWVKQSPVRIRLFQSAHTDFDVEAADELFSTWKERKTLAEATVQVEEKERKQQIKAAATGSSSASSDRAPRKMYRRADVIRLMRDDPERYRSLAGEILQAYEEGRVVA